MNKFTLSLMAGALLATASCNTETGNTDEENQAKIDSIVDVRVEEIRAELYQRNDSIINELAMWRADSILAARAGKKVVARKPKPKAPVVETLSEGGTEVSDKPKETTSKSKWDANKEEGTSSESKWNNKESEEKGTSSKSKWGN